MITQGPCYYLMKERLILRLEEPLNLSSIPAMILENLLDPLNILVMNQDQANNRVAFFRDEIVEWEEFISRKDAA